MIGQFYTKPSYRGKGYGASLLRQLTNQLLATGHEKCGLIADTKNIPSNVVFKKVGYMPIYEQLSVFI